METEREETIAVESKADSTGTITTNDLEQHQPMKSEVTDNDLYSYVSNQNSFTSERFKLEIHGLPRNCDFAVCFYFKRKLILIIITFYF